MNARGVPQGGLVHRHLDVQLTFYIISQAFTVTEWLPGGILGPGSRHLERGVYGLSRLGWDVVLGVQGRP